VTGSGDQDSRIEEFRRGGHRVVDLLADLLADIETRPVFPRVEPEDLARLFDAPVPLGPTSLEEILSELEHKLLPYCTHVSHPGYFGLITPSPLPVGILGDLIASALNQNVGAYSIGPSAVALERRTVRWLNDLIGFDGRAGGNLTSGGTMANFIALKLARDFATRDRAQQEGLKAPLAAYTSEERHVSVDKAVDAVGIGRENLRLIPTDEKFRIRMDALEAALRADREQGRTPACIIAMGGSTNTGAVDPLGALRRVADREGVWLHVDAAYGGGMLLSKEHAGVLTGLDLSDSVTLDPHKWFYAPLDAGAILVRDEEHLTRSFGLRPSYLTDPLDRDDARYNYYVHGFEQSRRFRGLKVWMGLKRYGVAELGRWIERNVEQARQLSRLADDHPDFEVATEPVMSAVCIGYRSKGMDAAREAELHARVARRVEESGRFWISTTVLKDRTWFRVNPVNFHTRPEHMDGLFELLCRECAEEAGREPSPGAR